MKKAKEATELLNKFIAKAEVDTPLINFLHFMLKTVEAGAGPLFQLLRQKYSVSLARDPSFEKVCHL